MLVCFFLLAVHTKAQNVPTNPPSQATIATSTITARFTGGIMQVSTLSVRKATLISSLAEQISSFLIGLAIEDSRGSANGWSITMSSSHLTTVAAPLAPASNTSPLIKISPSYRYGGWWGSSSAPCHIKITIASSGVVGVATFTATLLGGSTCHDYDISEGVVLTSKASEANIGNGRLLLDFPPGTYVRGDSYDIAFDMVDYHQCSLAIASPTPADPGTSIYGLRTGNSKNLTGLSTISDEALVVVAEVGTGAGVFRDEVNLSCIVRSGAFAGSYSGQAVFTMN